MVREFCMANGSCPLNYYVHQKCVVFWEFKIDFVVLVHVDHLSNLLKSLVCLSA